MPRNSDKESTALIPNGARKVEPVNNGWLLAAYIEQDTSLLSTIDLFGRDAFTFSPIIPNVYTYASTHTVIDFYQATFRPVNKKSATVPLRVFLLPVPRHILTPQGISKLAPSSVFKTTTTVAHPLVVAPGMNLKSTPVVIMKPFDPSVFVFRQAKISSPAALPEPTKSSIRKRKQTSREQVAPLAQQHLAPHRHT